jgi:hypothetical protein
MANGFSEAEDPDGYGLDQADDALCHGEGML